MAFQDPQHRLRLRLRPRLRLRHNHRSKLPAPAGSLAGSFRVALIAGAVSDFHFEIGRLLSSLFYLAAAGFLFAFVRRRYDLTLDPLVTVTVTEPVRSMSPRRGVGMSQVSAAACGI